MKKVVLTALGVLLTVAGVVWALQGLGYIGGSSMSGQSLWAIVGPIVAALGVALIYVTFRGPEKRR
ncbi:hypothetical protein F1D05_19700 [Kribbella qitaiheensis]|uniref:Uncharacterized protein n=1 Tax=Kribbella qitaiheensis TaxID=1544730 RepID=A0A7G6X0H4_9ACTN|nr:hypothetical protein [Kribbella qitaiheensis]QNE19739.1 hypothetical protein F1D05_19700 [Kribbella qitaiheensis]